MKSAIIGRLTVILFILIVNSLHSNAQTKNNSASHNVEARHFVLEGTDEGIVNDLATIRFSIINDGNANLTVTDGKGKYIETLVDDEITPGNYTLYYRPAPALQSGEYFLRFEMNGKTKSERFLISH